MKTVLLLSSFHRGNQGTEFKEMGQGLIVVKQRDLRFRSSCERGYRKGPEEAVSYLGSGVTGDCGLPGVVLGTELWASARTVSTLSQ